MSMLGRRHLRLESSSASSQSSEKNFTNRIKSCSTQVELLDLISRCQFGSHGETAGIESLNKHHISATMTSMAKIGARRTLERDGLQLGHELVSRAIEIRETLGPRQASSILWAASAIGLRLAPSSLDVLLEKGLPALIPSSHPNSKDLSMILLSCSSFAYEPSSSWMMRFEEASLRLLQKRPPSDHSFNPLQLSHILYSLASLGHTPGRAWLEAFSSSSRTLLSKLDTASLCAITWAAGVHQRSLAFLWPPNAWVKEVITSSLARLPTMDSKHLASIMWAVARLQVPDADKREISLISSPHSFEERRPSKEWMDCFLNASRQHASAFDPRSISNLLHALVELKYRPSNEWLDEMLACFILKDSSTSPPQASLQDVSSLLKSCHTLGYFPPPAVMQTLLSVAHQEMARVDHLIRVGSISDESLVAKLNASIGVVHSLGKMRLVPRREWLDKLWSITGHCFHRLSLSQLPRLLAAVSLLSMQSAKQSNKAKQSSIHLVPKQWSRQALVVLTALLQDERNMESSEDNASKPPSTIPLKLILQTSWALSSCPCFNPGNITLRTRLVNQAALSVNAVFQGRETLSAKSLRQISQLPTLLAAAGCNRAVDKSQFGKIIFSFCLSHSSQLDSASISRLLSGLDAMGYSPSKSWMVNILSIMRNGGGMTEAAKDPEALLNLLFSICRLIKKVSPMGQPGSSIEFISPALSTLMGTSVLSALESGKLSDPETPMRLLLTLSNLGALPNQTDLQAQSDEGLWWKRVYAALEAHLDASSLSSLPSLLYFIASIVIASRRLPHPVPHPETRFVDRIMERVLDRFLELSAEDVARVLCGLVGLGVGASWLPRVSLAIETNSASFSRADHLLIQRAWIKMGQRKGIGDLC
jgi:hypothetical protein